MSEEDPPPPPATEPPGKAPAPADERDNPISKASLGAAWQALQNLWKRIEKRAPQEVRDKMAVVAANAEDVLARADALVKEKVALAKTLEDFGAELRGRKPWEPNFYRDGRLAIVRAQDPIKIEGAVDHKRLEEFWERYVRRAEQAFARLEWFFSRVGLLVPEENKAPKKPWEQPYINFDQYRELIWSKVAKGEPRVRRE